MKDRTTQLASLKKVKDTCTCFNLRKASRVVTQLFDEVLQPSGLLVNQFTLLTAISLAGSVTITHLAQELVMDRTTLTRNLKPLERQGFVQIQPGRDGRVRVVSLTDKGESTLRTALPLWEIAQGRVINELGQERWNMLLLSLSNTVSLLNSN
ncbi:MarR family winged helix-turn-helix transcriptional regulator [Aetokthonos hydrillicola Thurmond2011]|jgi:DNA-binding MarR family transcriptional regulator|uniref:MarR family winged helix-turn-helix transcriptional regulator n=1 Tax=Aetokthonos hydrillicola Thurmond2011 TaxID=2712845 RepID=A0AAP5I7Z9_9CYAN|nr:MarR family winged helix-turn-helix transcriptional regulator [Aetokthonos hydrillicola]MBO3461750.1 winged helix-turn-helix transcriptional regulator [Aetokthonos hydrillicola CCALA 1050]MBW4583869.1 MarR family winged helix-turn-helix transcriptional regulator [Aetokthonos hydrillicola CCALA 1050]MDR9895434.1 MarR family winged helix-turn-helix transcriptional regulator [Aetokthonos hydrillicola Thurmond2011]